VIGKYNAGWIAVRNDKHARKVLNWWKDRCFEWCRRFPQNGKFGEQKYLDDFPKLSKKVSVLNNYGANVAPWNLNDFDIKKTETHKLTVNDQPLIFFHFHALRIEGERSFKVENEMGRGVLQITNPSYIIPQHVQKYIYKPYISVLKKNIKKHGLTCLKKKDKSSDVKFLRNIKYFLLKLFARAAYSILYR